MQRALSVKPGLGRWQTVQTQIRRRTVRRLIRVCTVCVNHRKIRAKWNSLKSPFRTIFPAYTQRQTTHLYYQCFDFVSYRLLSCTSNPFWKGVYSKRKYFTPKWKRFYSESKEFALRGANSFLLEKGTIYSERDASTEKVSIHFKTPLINHCPAELGYTLPLQAV